MKKTIIIQAFIFLYAISLYAQPAIDGIFDGSATWGPEVAVSDGQAGWAGVNLDKLYVTHDGTYLYIGVTTYASADWQSWGIAINRNGIGSASEVWGYPITYGHTQLPDLIIKGHFGQGGTPYAEVRDWNGSSYVRKDNDGNDAGLDLADFYSEENEMIEVRLRLSTFGNPSMGDIQVYISGNVQGEHATFDALPDDEIAQSWNDQTTLDHYAFDIPFGGSPAVVVSPTNPADDVPVTITLNAIGTDLEGVSEVYLHSGVSTTADNLQAFSHVIGNWGQDDGIGAMTNIGTDEWEITLPSLRAYYQVPITEDVFGLNFLFRNADGTLKEDQGGSNYFESTDPGSYFTITAPENDPAFVPQFTSINTQFEANVTPASWTLEEVDENDQVIETLANGGSVLNFTPSILVDDIGNKRYRVTSNFTSGSKYKFFELIGYEGVVDMPRPSWTKPGINYHEDDPTKVTLVLHAPNFTRYYKHPQGQPPLLVGSNETAPKEVVFVVGDFNDWQPSNTYKMYRDTDGWDPDTQEDADGDGDRGDYWWIELDGLIPGKPYVFQYLMDDGLQVADPYTEQVSDFDDVFITADRYSNLIDYPEEAQDRASVLQTNQDTFAWEAPAFDPPSINDLNIYELHFRDFTEEGTYLSAIYKLDYLKALGINAIHVMPISEFEGNSSWGYNPNFYFAPDKYYGKPEHLKKFIDECHKREILVFNDLVLNHAFYSNVMARMYWNEVDNKPANDNPWFNSDHKMVSDPAGWWGADWNHESEHTQKMMDRIIDFWLQEYQFDGYRFDFTKGIGQTAQDPNDPWASSYDQDRIDLLRRIVDGLKARNPGAVVIFEHLADSAEDAVLADSGILMWSGAGHHQKIKEFMLGWNGEDIYSTGIFTAQGFTFANWMSYMESHDEERQAYEVMNYGNGNENYTTADIVNRLELGAAFNLLFPGPRLIWQFEELAYDVSIDFNGRTGEKPVRWEYFFDQDRKQLWRLMAQAFYLRNEYNLYATAPDYGNIGSTDGVDVPRKMMLNDGQGHYVLIVANLDPNNQRTITPGFPVTGIWYRYNGDPAVDGSTISIDQTGQELDLPPSTVYVLTNFESGWTDDCSDPEACCVHRLFVWDGSESTNWNDPLNWEQNEIPLPCDYVLIPQGKTVEIFDGDKGRARKVTTEDGAYLWIGGDLRIYDFLD